MAAPSQPNTPTTESESSGDGWKTLKVRANGAGGSYYRIYPGTCPNIELGDEADTEDSAAYEDRVVLDNPPNYAEGYVGDNGVDTYRYQASPDSEPSPKIINDGNVSLEITIGGEPYTNATPGEGTNSERVGPDAPPQGDTQVRVEAVGDGASNYSLSSGETGGQEFHYEARANPGTTAAHPDSVGRYSGAYGFVGAGGVDTYSTYGNLYRASNKGTATLKIYQNGELWTTLEPGETREPSE